MEVRVLFWAFKTPLPEKGGVLFIHQRSDLEDRFGSRGNPRAETSETRTPDRIPPPGVPVPHPNGGVDSPISTAHRLPEARGSVNRSQSPK